MIAALFGGKTIAVHRPLHSGFGRFSLHLYGRISTEAIANHSLMALFETFSHPDRYAKAVEQAMLGKPRAYLSLYSAQTDASQKDIFFRNSPALCTACVEQDLKDFHFAYYRRQHQVLASEYCAHHERKLVTSCDKCGSKLSFLLLPTLSCPDCASSYVVPETDASDAHRFFGLRLSQFIGSMLLARVPRIPQSQRLAILGARTATVVRSRSTGLGNNLARHLRAIYGDEFLKRLRLFPSNQPSLGWPALLLSGAVMVEHPIANALLISALWGSASDYLAELQAQPQLGSVGSDNQEILTGTNHISTDMLKKVYHAASLNGIPPSHPSLRSWLNVYPGLRERIDYFAQRQRVRQV